MYITGRLETGILLFGVGIFVIYRKTQPAGAASFEGNRLLAFLDGEGRAINTQIHAFTEFNHKVDAVYESLFKTEKNEE